MWELIVLGVIGSLAVVFVLAILIGGANLVADSLEGLSGGPERETCDEIRALCEELRAEHEVRR